MTCRAPVVLTAAALALALPGLGLIALPAHAADDDIASPRNWALEFKVGPYRPGIDREKRLLKDANGHGPYRRIFGRGDEVMVQLEAQWEFLTLKWGTLALGGLVGFSGARGKGIKASTTTDVVTDGDTADGAADPAAVRVDTTVFRWMPTALNLIYRFDWPARHLGVPLVPFAKAGIAYYWWWVTDGLGDISKGEARETGRDVGGKGYGGVIGTHLSFGLQFHLNILDREAARHLDLDYGVNDSYLFVEVLFARVNDFNSGDKLDLSDETWLAGMMFEF